MAVVIALEPQRKRSASYVVELCLIAVAGAQVNRIGTSGPVAIRTPCVLGNHGPGDPTHEIEDAIHECEIEKRVEGTDRLLVQHGAAHEVPIFGKAGVAAR